MTKMRFPLRHALAATCAALCVLQAAAAPGTTPLAKVGEAVVTQQEFDAAYAQAARGKFYHGKTPEAEVAQLQREVAQSLVDEVLLVREARRRKLKPDAATVQKTIASYEERYRDSAQWKTMRAEVLPRLKDKLERDSVLAQLAAQVKHVEDPTAAQLQQYWREHQDKFTSPEQVHLGVILLKVDPSSPQAQWDGAKNEGAAIVRRLKAGADFAELAKLHSADPSAERGGDMGYVHAGMLPEPAQKAVDPLKPGQFTDAVTLLEGVAVFRLVQRKPPVLNALDAVRERARELYLRERADEAWTTLLASLRRETPVQVDETRFLPLARAEAKAPAR
jgi:parvulin-like peptidyl-prolyl isomerase